MSIPGGKWRRPSSANLCAKEGCPDLAFFNPSRWISSSSSFLALLSPFDWSLFFPSCRRLYRVGQIFWSLYFVHLGLRLYFGPILKCRQLRAVLVIYFWLNGSFKLASSVRKLSFKVRKTSMVGTSSFIVVKLDCKPWLQASLVKYQTCVCSLGNLTKQTNFKYPSHPVFSSPLRGSAVRRRYGLAAAAEARALPLSSKGQMHEFKGRFKGWRWRGRRCMHAIRRR